MRKKYLTCLVAWCLMLGGLQAGTTGKIAGVVTDAQTGSPMVAANIYIEGHPYGATSDLDGYYHILNIPPGNYTIVAQVLGYRETRVTNVQVNVDLTTRLNYKLSEESVQGAEVTVVAERDLVQKDLTSSSVQVTAAEIAALPVDNYNEVVNLQAGVVAGHFRGGRDGEVSYMIDGIPVNDPYNNAAAVQVENQAIQQLEVISGTFNAEYGQAMSGIVNIITKEGGSKIEGDIAVYGSNYYSNDERIFPNINTLDGRGSQNLQGSLSGALPFFNKIKFFASGRLVNNDGYLYGARAFLTTDNDPLLPSGDSSLVSMSDSEDKSFNAKLTYYLTPAIKVNYGVLWADNFNRYYDHGFRLTPDAIKRHFNTNWNHNIVINHALSASSFYTLRVARNYGEFEGYVYEDPNDPRYVIPEQGLPQSNYTFRSGGNQTDRYKRSTTTNLAKLDFASQVSREHKIGVGVMFRQHEISAFGTAFRSQIVGFDPVLLQDIFEIVYPQRYSPGYDQYTKQPIELTAYLQDKIEYEDFIINAGLRFDYFDPRTDYLSDLRNPEFNPLFPSGNMKVDPKAQISPRLGVAFPISTNGVIHVSYGHFFQIPNVEQVYQGINDLPDGSVRYFIDKSGLNTIAGNPDLDAMRTVTYEMGLQQGLTDDLRLEFTTYYRDIRNLVGTQIIETYDQNQYARYINTDYGNVSGVILSMEKRMSSHWAARLDYTYQIAKGNASDPRSAFFDNQASPPVEPEKQLLRLDWDQRSTLNLSLSAGTPGNWLVGLVGKLGTSTPYTADIRFTGVNVNFRNNRVKPISILFDFRAEKNVNLFGTRVSTYLWVQNLFDRRNEWGVYGSTGRANNDLNTQFAGDVFGIHSIDDYVNNPTFYSPPREIRLGFSFGIH